MGAFFALYLGISPDQSIAQQSGNWSTFAADEGIGSGICSALAPSNCFRIRCAKGRGVEFVVDTGFEKSTKQVVITLRVDRFFSTKLLFEDDYAMQHATLLPDRDANFLEALKTGNQLTIEGRNAPQFFNLRGASKAIEAGFEECKKYAEATARPSVGHGGQSYRAPNEADISLTTPEADTAKWTLEEYQNTDFWGHDIQSGLIDPLLNNISLNQCRALCFDTKECKFFTHNGRTDTCFLKSAFGSAHSYERAVTGEYKGGKPALLPPPTSGPGLSIDPAMRWRVGENLAQYHQRIRAHSANSGETCGRERSALLHLASNLKFDALPDKMQAGKSAEFHWIGNSLQNRIPVWLVISSPDFVRFDGQGFFSLGPGSPNPFGMEVAATETRAFTALWARGAGYSGSFGLTPLRSGKARVTVRLVAWLRECQQEFLISETKTVIDVSPAPAELVLVNDTGRADLTNQIIIEKYDRKIEFNETGLLITSTNDGSEIVLRAGKQVGISPTHRFVTVENDGATEIIDLIDGHVVGRAESFILSWAMNDSFVITSTVPWGEVNIISTFGNTVKLTDQVTGPSCCLAQEGTRIGVDLENAVLSVWGKFGYFVASLQNLNYASFENAGSGYNSSQIGSLPLYRTMYNSIGPVAPASFHTGYGFAGGLHHIYKPGDNWYEGGRGNEGKRPMIEVVNIRLERVGLKATDIAQQSFTLASIQNETGVILRSSVNSVDTQKSIENQLARMGIFLAPELRGELLTEAPRYKYENEYTHMREFRETRSQGSMARLMSDAIKAGWRFDWSGQNQDSSLFNECDHLTTDNDTHTEHLWFPRDVETVSRIAAPDGPLWITTSACQAGATLGSLRGKSIMTILDLSRPFSGSTEEVIVEINGYYTNSPRPSFFEADFLTKLSGRTLITYAPEQGVISLFDLEKRKFIRIIEGAPNGDLLSDVFMTKDRQHIVQLNSDGSLYFHRISDGKIVLSGRVVDDELALWNEDFQFDATAEAASLIDLKFPGIDGQFSLDRFDAALKTPNLAVRVLSQTQIPPRPVIGLPPGLTGSIQLADNGDISISATVIGKYHIPLLHIYQDGVRTNTLPVTHQGTENIISVRRVPGARWVSILAEDANQLVSLPISTDLGEEPFISGNTLAVLIGVDRYSDERLSSLNFAKADADRMRQALLGLQKLGLDVESPTLLADRHATPQAILLSVKEMIGALGPGDHGVLFFAGHGLQDDNGQFYLGTTATDLDDLPHTALAWSELAKLLATSKSRLTILLDACHSGAADSGAFATNDNAVTGLSALPSNITILSASKGREFSQESGELGGGVFTLALERVLLTDRQIYDRNGNGRIEASELYIGVKALVVSHRKGLQTPWLTRNRMVGEYAVF